MGRNQVIVVVLALMNGACGALGQYVVGFNDTEERTGTRTRRVRIADVAPDVHVERIEPDGTPVPLTSRIDHVTYDVHETVEVPRSRMPMYFGTGLDLIGVGAFGYVLAQSDNDTRVLSIYGLVYSISAFIADVAFSVYYSIDQQPVVVGYEPAESKPVTYVGYLGDETRRATIDVAIADRVTLDFTQPPSPADLVMQQEEPGGPRLGATLPTPPTAMVLPRSKPPPKIEESWYGWQSIPIDALTISLMIYGTLNENYGLAAGAGGIHLASVPLIHLAHGQPENAGASLGLRLGMGFATGAAGLLAGALLAPLILAYGNGGENYFEIVGTVALYSAGIGFVVFSPLAAILDAAALGWEPDEGGPSVEIVPATSRTDDGQPTFGIAGRF